MNCEQDYSKKGNHWYLLILDVNKKTLFELDSAGGNNSDKNSIQNTDVIRKIVETMYSMYNDEKVELKVERKTQVPKQSNTFDCGVFTIAFIEHFLKGLADKKIENVKEWKI